MSDVAYSPRIKYIVLETDRHSEERWKRLLLVVSIPPALFLRVVFPNTVAFFSLSDCLLEHFVHDIVISNSNGGGSLNKGQGDFIGGDFTLVHEF